MSFTVYAKGKGEEGQIGMIAASCKSIEQAQKILSSEFKIAFGWICGDKEIFNLGGEVIGNWRGDDSLTESQIIESGKASLVWDFDARKNVAG